MLVSGWTSANHTDGIVLTVENTAPGTVTLGWIGAQPPYVIYRSTAPDDVTNPSNALGSTSAQSWVDTPSGNADFYYAITGECVSNPPEICHDLYDNDCDLLVDCADSDCFGQTCGAFGLVCIGGVCACLGGESSEVTCSDALDNDCDGNIDCSDVDCDGASCGPSGLTCLAGVCLCPFGQGSEVTCDDGVDNDCDGSIDCDDVDCNGVSCGPGGMLCITGACI